VACCRVSGERVVDVDLFRASVFRYLLMVSTSLSTSFVAVRTPVEDMFLAFRRLACDMPRSVNSGARSNYRSVVDAVLGKGPSSVPLAESLDVVRFTDELLDRLGLDADMSKLQTS
jgi:hypothetical protein